MSLQKSSGESASEKSSEMIPNATHSLISGIVAGVICTLACSPLDVAKVRLQVQGALKCKKYYGSLATMGKMIYKEEGIKGFYKGLGPALFTVPLFWGIYWASYDRLKCTIDEENAMNKHVKHIVSAIGAGAIGNICTNPFWVVRTRIQTEALHTDIRESVGPVRMLLQIYKDEGFRALYKGLGASFLGLSHVSIQFPLYEYMKELAREKRQDKESTIDIIVSSAVSKLIASCIAYPHEVLRARMQDERHRVHDGIWGVTRTIIKTEGFSALWSGLRINLIRVFPATISTFLTYEYLMRYLSEKHLS